MSLRPVAIRLKELLGRDVAFAEDCIGPPAERAIASQPAGGVVLLENLRFHAEEEKNDVNFAKGLAALCDAYVNDAFGAAHRAHASVEAIVRLVPQAGAGLLMEKELRYLGEALGNPARPFVAVLGGAKVSDKIEVIDNLIPRVDRLLIGGAMAYTFFKAMGKPVGKSLVEDDKLDLAREIMAKADGVRPTRPSPCSSCFPSITSSRPGSRPARLRKRCSSTMRRLAIAWGWTSVPRRRRRMRRRCATRRPWCGTDRWACSRSTTSRAARWRWPGPSPRCTERRSSAAAIRSRR